MNYLLISAILIVLSGFMAMSYRQYAEKYGWPRGSIWYNMGGWIKAFALFTVIPGAIEIFFQIGFFKGLGISIGLFILAPVIMYILKTYSQYFIYLLTFTSITLWIIGGAEQISVN